MPTAMQFVNSDHLPRCGLRAVRHRTRGNRSPAGGCRDSRRANPYHAAWCHQRPADCSGSV